MVIILTLWIAQTNLNEPDEFSLSERHAYEIPYYRIFFLLCLTLVSAQSEKRKDKLQQGVMLVDSLRRLHEYSMALAKAFQLLPLAESTENWEVLGDLQVQIGRLYKGKGLIAPALAAYEVAFDLRYKSLYDTCGAASVKNNMVSALDDSFYVAEEYELLELALKHSKEAEQLIEGQYEECWKTHIRILINQANILDGVDSIEQAILINQKALKLSLEKEDTVLAIKSMYGLVNRLVNSSKLKRSDALLDGVIKLFSKYKDLDEALVGQVYEAKGVIQLQLGFPEESLMFLEKAEGIFLRIPEEKLALTNLYYNKANAYEAMDNFAEAEKAYRLSRQNYIESSPVTSFFQLLGTREVLMNYRKNHLKSERRNFFLILFSMATALFALFRNYVASKAKNKAERELFLLRHDIVKNNLITINNHINAYLPNLNDEASYGLIMKIKRMLEKTLDQIGYSKLKDNAKHIRLKAFVLEMHQKATEVLMKEVQNYTYLDGIPDYYLSGKLSTQLEVVITEIFNNIREHANCKTASINFSVGDDGLNILIKDDGVGADLSQAKRSGLDNITIRIKKLNGSISFNSIPGEGFSTTIQIHQFPERT